MIVYIVYNRESPHTMVVFKSHRSAINFIKNKIYPNNWILRQRKVI